MGGRTAYVINSAILLGIFQTTLVIGFAPRKVLVTRVSFNTMPREYQHNVTAAIDFLELHRLRRPSNDRASTNAHNHHKPATANTGKRGNNTQYKEDERQNKDKRIDKDKDRIGDSFLGLLTKKTKANVRGSTDSNQLSLSFTDNENTTNGDTAANDTKMASFPGSNSKIVGGSQTYPNGWPSEASIQYLGTDGYWYHFCGGSLIHQQWVVTVAHCLVELGDYVIRIVLGDYRLGSFDGREQIAVPSNIFVHTYFNQPLWTYDIGLIKLQFPATLNSYVQVITMATEVMEPFGQGHECYVAGWGSISGAGDDLATPDYLQQTRMTVISKQDCRHQLMIKDVLADSQICIESDLSSVCIGDSGSPLQCRVHDQWVLVGMASWIRDEQCEPSIPNVFSRMSSFHDWCHAVIEQY